MNYFYRVADAFIAAVEERIAAALRPGASSGDDERLLGEASLHLVHAGGKRFRPRFVRLLGGLFELPEPALLHIGVGVELLHAASLLHDDVVDAASVRRHRPTANAQWSNSVAVLAGDWLLTRAVLEMTPLGLPVVADGIRTVAAMTVAAIREVEARGRTDIDYAAWRRMAEGKTGELLAWCGRAICTVGGDPTAIDTLSRLGRSWGVAFQMADDLGDLLDETSGKERFADLRTQTPSFALSVILERDPVLKQRVSAAWSRPAASGDLEELGRALAASASVGLAQAMLRDELRLSMALLSTLAPPTIVDQFLGLVAGFSRDQVSTRGAA
jgi:heptaprenyl diphosphate synthase